MAAARARSRRSLRHRILTATLSVTAVATVAFGVPLGVVLTRMEHERVVLRLEREASDVLAQVPDEKLTDGGPLRLPEPLGGSTLPRLHVAVYSAAGRLLSGVGPQQSPLARLATTRQHETNGWEDGSLVVAEPLRADRPGTAAIRVAVDRGTLVEEQRESVWLMVALGLGVLLLAGAVAFAVARRLSRPLEAIAADAQRLGQGDFTVRPEGSQTVEIDEVGQAVDATARRLGALVDRERAFTADASHQIRTPLTALRVTLEAAPLTPGADLTQVCSEAVAELDRLEETVEHLLAVARDVDVPGAVLQLDALLEDASARWRKACDRAGRDLRLEIVDEPPVVRASPTGLSHVLDVLIENSLNHGGGPITVTARAAWPGVAIDVHDEGPGIAGAAEEIFRRRHDGARGHGIGLALARSLVEADGGRLEVTDAGPAPTFTVLLPAAAVDVDGAPAGPAYR